jgi:hypothetical protein
MTRTAILRALIVSFILSSSVSAADKWTSLRAGMTRGQATALLGSELTASSGRGFEVAIYDGSAEVVFLNGEVVAWTAPASSKAEPPPSNTWRFDQVARARGNSTRRPVESRTGNGAILPAYRL